MKKDGNPDVHEELKGFDITVNEFGQIEGNFDIKKLNAFLDKEIDDKKLKNHTEAAKGEEE